MNRELVDALDFYEAEASIVVFNLPIRILASATIMHEQATLLDKAADIVTAFVTKNSLSATELPQLILAVHSSLARLGQPVEDLSVGAKVPAVSVKKSIAPEYLVCLEDGLKFKSLKRHLKTKYGMTPEDYRAKWNLPKDYPMVAPSYSATRSALAKQMGLGSGRQVKTANARSRGTGTR